MNYRQLISLMSAAAGGPGGGGGPDPNPKSTVFACGFECGRLGSVGEHWTAPSGATISTGTVRSGSRSLRVNSSFPIVQCVQAAHDRAIIRFYIRFATLPSADAYLCFSGNSAGSYIGLAFKQSDSKLYCARGLSGGTTPAALGASGFTVTTGTWYRVDLHINQTSGAKSVDAQVDGTDIGQVTGTDATAAQAIRLGNLMGGTFDIYFDDFIMSNTPADYPLGAGHVDHFVPTSDGAHSTGSAGNFVVGSAGANITDASTTSYQLIDEVPLDDTTPDTNDYINGSVNGGAGGSYVEHIFGPASGISTPTLGPRAVEVVVAHHQEGSGTGSSTFTLHDNGSDDTVHTVAAGATTIRYARKHYTDPPSAASAWTTASGNGNFNNLRHRFGYTDGDPNQYFDGVMIEAEFSE